MVKQGKKAYCIIPEERGCFYIPRYDDDIAYDMADELQCIANTYHYLINAPIKRRNEVISMIRKEMSANKTKVVECRTHETRGGSNYGLGNSKI